MFEDSPEPKIYSIPFILDAMKKYYYNAVAMALAHPQQLPQP